MLAVLLALASAAGYGGSDYAGGLAARRGSVIRITILAQAVSAALMILILPLAGRPTPSPGGLAWGAAAGVGEAIGALALYAGFRNAAFSVAGPLSAVGSAGFSVLAGLLLGEHPGMLAILGIGLALPAIVGVSVSPGSARPGRAGVIWGLLAGASFALLFIALDRAGSGSGPWPLVASQFTALVVVVCLGAATGEARLPARHAAGLAALTGAIGAAGEGLYFYATHAGLLAVTAVLTSLYPAVTIVLARLFQGERLTVTRLAGLCLAAASVGLIAAAGAG
jgi:drug/metabolite transporter (DMT)-like permease